MVRASLARRDKAQTQTFNGLHVLALVSACPGAGVNGCRSLQQGVAIGSPILKKCIAATEDKAMLDEMSGV